ncbi:multicopper oxidase domain-containing protein [Phytoactinopolyspora halotolerans]|uniref:Copper-containing nitrite reductase n=1 Tax=Phytoactinopolyspora halotolerans TaxID=1981512 RepID=A0A6L9S6E1_9ACTN|nr:multicopper oxidase domain-containing protein [Phytoactinopolyspora halotolerans]NEE00639.1 multicopper oxidase domain-containing protein [Phytoactinopolyspora halotolerans]
MAAAAGDRRELPLVEARTHPGPSYREPRLYRTAHAVIFGYLALAAVVLAADPAWLNTRWLTIHLVFLGAATTAIMVWSSHFSQALTRSVTGDRWLGRRVAVLTVGVVSVLGGVAPTGHSTLAVSIGAVTGVALILLAVGAHALVLARMARTRFGGPLKDVVWFYVAACGALSLGAPLGAALATGVPATVATSTGSFAAHLHLNIVGWVGLTVLGSLLMLGPATLRARMHPRVPRAVRPVLGTGVVGLALTVAGLWADVHVVAVAGLGLYIAGIGILMVALAATARNSRARRGPALALGLGMGWFAAYLVLDLVAVATDGSAGAVRLVTDKVPMLALGFLAQVLIAALTFLLPVLFGGGPAGHKSLAGRLALGWSVRLGVLNVGVVLLASVDTGGWRTLGWLLAAGALVAFLTLAVSVLIPEAVSTRLRWAWTPAVVVAPVIVLLTAIAAVPGGDDGSAASATSATSAAGSDRERHVVDVVLSDFHVEPARLEVPGGADLVLRVRNEGVHNHDLRLENDGDTFATRSLRGGEEDELHVGTVTEAVEAWCTIGAHRQAGMEMEIVPVDAASGDLEDDGATTHETNPGAGGGHGMHDGETSGDVSGADGATATNGSPDLEAALSGTPSQGKDFEARDARLEPAPGGTVHEIRLPVQETDVVVAPGIQRRMWTFGGSVPGPVLRGKVGDVVEVTLVNEGSMAHSIDFHASEVAPDVEMRSIEPGESLVYRFRAERAGVWMYHCGTAPVLQHVANGMYGAVVIDPPELEPVDHEYLLVQSDMYVGDGDEPAPLDDARRGAYDLVTFNGYVNQYLHDPLTVGVGERVRIWVLAAGPNGGSAFHVVGSQFETVFKEGGYLLRPDEELRGGSQTLDLAASQGGFVEFTLDRPGEYPFLTHRLGDAALGATGLMLAE